MDEEEQLEALALLSTAVGLIDPVLRPEEVSFEENVDALVEHLRQHGAPAVKVLIEELWD